MVAHASRRVVRRSRALGLALTPKAVKYFEKRPYPPGEHGRARRPNKSDYSSQLLEKQRLRAQYGIREAQLRRAFEEAHRRSGRTGEVLVELLETRLDAVVLRAGIARTIAQARQSVVHRHIEVDGRLVDKPSYRVRPGQVVAVRERSRPMTPFVVAAANGHRDVLPTVPGYLALGSDGLSVRLEREPRRAEVPVTCDVALVVEFYAR
ncbi:30S ribosomal protein S4 [Angustibacter luteus]|uniref:Small ribosomal subunit protein uS4 n=1 Tax=Angustibacter luteus TaxID=658456 RepID=A0ABW1JA54_9ACTN